MEEKKLNQILSSNDNEKAVSHMQNHTNKTSRFFKFQFTFCLVGAIVACSYYLYLQYDRNKKEALSKELLTRTSITNLYENNEFGYSSIRVSTENQYQTDSTNFSIVGIIEIKIIGIYYPIINEFRYDLLKIAPCKFLGPNPNEVRKSLHCRT